MSILNDLLADLQNTLAQLSQVQQDLANALQHIADQNAEIGNLQQNALQLQAQIVPKWEQVANQIIDSGKAFAKFNIPYKFGGDNFAEGGLDCSGFVKLLYDLFAGTNLPRVSGNQSQAGIQVVQADARRGDLLFFTYDQRNNGLPTHVGIYAGDNQMLHDNNDTDRIHFSPVSWNTVTAIRRFIQG